MIHFTLDFAKSFAEEWIASWNSHDIDIILQHYSEDFSIQSRIAAKLKPESNGSIVGKDAVREYWSKGLSINKNLEFQLLDVLIGINGLTIYYVNLGNSLRAVEMMFFNEEGKVCKAFVNHSQ
jgi:ketosteroid isomerase-like protein